MAIQDDITKLVKPPPAAPSLPVADTPKAIRAKTGLERLRAGEVASEEVTAKSTDGVFTFTVRVVKT